MNTPQSLIAAARSFMHRGGLFSPEEVADKAHADGTCIIHAVHELYAGAIEDGRLPTDICSLCTGRNRAGAGDHNLCLARAAHGLPTPQLDGGLSPCSCFNCQKGA